MANRAAFRPALGLVARVYIQIVLQRPHVSLQDTSDEAYHARHAAPQAVERARYEYFVNLNKRARRQSSYAAPDVCILFVEPPWHYY
jgi:hypothetical protein